MRYIIVDLEATCWENVRDPDRMETIEIGAVELLSAQMPSSRKFNRFIRPVVERELSDFCRRLTAIRQRDVDLADEFSLVFPEFLEWIGEEPFFLCSWGGYDLTQLRRDCDRHGMARALNLAGLPLEGTHHRGIDDARNIARLANRVLPILESSGVLALD